MKKNSRLSLLAATTLGTALLVSGCKKQEKVVVVKPPAPSGISQQVLDKFRPDETGAVMVVMYHRFLSTEPDSDLNRRPDTFRKDLETFYKKGYYPVNAIDFVENKMDVPAGKTPIVLTFDDSLPSQFTVTPNAQGEPKIDANSAIGIMETFNKKHADWPLKGTFFVLPREGRNGFPFGQADYVADKLNYLMTKGYEIGNHTSTHTSMRGMDATKVQWELGTALRDIQAFNKTVTMDVMAIPYGIPPRDKTAREKLLSGESDGTAYINKAIFLAAWRPDLSPITKADKRYTNAGSYSEFDVKGLERVTPNAKKPNEPGVLEYWIKYFDEHPRDRYISDGDVSINAVPNSRKSAVDPQRVKALGAKIQYYGNGKSGGKLSVE
jgi:hypothetical protein